jgi:hypothetical protein
MAPYVPRVSAVEAVKFTGDNVDEIIACAMLADPPHKPKVADGVSPVRGIAIWNARRDSWDYVNTGDWCVASDNWARKYDDEMFAKEFERKGAE